MSQALAKNIKQRMEKGADLDQIAILGRTNRVLGLVERALIAEGIPYHIYKGVETLTRKEVQMALAAVRCVLNQHDEMAFTTLAEAMPGIGKKVLDDILTHHALMRDSGQSLGIIEDWGNENPNSKSFKTIMDFMLPILRMMMEGPQDNSFSHWLTKEDTLIGQWFHKLCAKSNKPEKALAERRANLDIISQAMRIGLEKSGEAFDPQNPSAAWHNAMEVMVNGADVADAQKTGSVTLSTVHRAKGLEWDIVYLYGFSSGLFPLSRSTKLDKDELEIANDTEAEERRLAYVAATRAKNILKLMHANHYDFPGMESNRPRKFSVFATEMNVYMKPIGDLDENGGKPREIKKGFSLGTLGSSKKNTDNSSMKNNIENGVKRIAEELGSKTESETPSVMSLDTIM